MSAFTYSFDNVGNAIAVLEVNGDRVTWGYDSLYQLVREQRTGANAYDVTYAYDPSGNRQTKSEAGVTTTYTYDPADRLLAEQRGVSIVTYSYDADGNTVLRNNAGALTTYTWGADNKLLTLSSPGGALETFTYSGDGKRRVKQDSSGTTRFVWDENKVIMETDGSGTTVVVYSLSADVYGELLSQNRGGVSRFYHSDGLGSTAQLTDANQAVTDSYLYRAFGEEQAASGATTNSYRWLGLLGYDTDLQSLILYVRARYDDPGRARFLSRDPSEGELNFYVYAENNPVNIVDPTGLKARRRRHARQRHAQVGAQSVVLIFDDAPHSSSDAPTGTEHILRELRAGCHGRHNIKAYFFVIGTNIVDMSPTHRVDNRGLITEMRAAAHVIENHTMHHRQSFYKKMVPNWENPTQADRNAGLTNMMRELQELNELLSQLGVPKPRFYRAPGESRLDDMAGTPMYWDILREAARCIDPDLRPLMDANRSKVYTAHDEPPNPPARQGPSFNKTVVDNVVDRLRKKSTQKTVFLAIHDPTPNGDFLHYLICRLLDEGFSIKDADPNLTP